MAGLRSPEPEQYWQNTPQNPVLGAAASGLRALKDAGGVVGEFFLGDAPEEIERWSYGNSPIRERVPGTSPRYPEFKKDRFMPVVDAAFLPVGETVAAAKLAGAGARGLYNAGMRGYEAATDGAASMGRRDALKKIGQGVGASALGGAGVREIFKLASPEDMAKTAVKAVVRAPASEFFAAEKALLERSREIRRAAAAPYKKQIKELNESLWNSFSKTPEGQQFIDSAPYVIDHTPHHSEWVTSTPYGKPVEDLIRRSYDAAYEAQQNAYSSGLRDLHGDPRFIGYKTIDDILDIRRSGDMDAYEAALKEHGILNDDEVISILKDGGSYSDPVSGYVAHIDSGGSLEWKHPQTGWAHEFLDWQRWREPGWADDDGIPF